MMWQFGERGYDVSIDDPCRLCEKPPHWEYMEDQDRVKLYKVYQALIKLRKSTRCFTAEIRMFRYQ